MTKPATELCGRFASRSLSEALADLQRRLGTRLLDFPLADPDLGLDSSILRRMLEHWRERFDWRAVERGSTGSSTCSSRSTGWTFTPCTFAGRDQPLPLIVSHGWPSSFAEILPAVDLLTRPGEFGGDPADAFDVVIASLPGYAFSGPPLELADAGARRSRGGSTV